MKTYCNLEMLRDEAGFTDEEIPVLPRISSWAITSIDDDSYKKKRLGLMTKRILDYGRLVYIKKQLGQNKETEMMKIAAK